jgi:hypothetical protein
MEQCSWSQHPIFAAESCLCGTLDTSEPGLCTYCPFCSVYGNTLDYPSWTLPYDPRTYAQDWTTDQFDLSERHQGNFANTGYTAVAESPDAFATFRPDCATWPFKLPEDDVSTTPELSHTAQISYHDADLAVAHGTGWQNLQSETSSQSGFGSPTCMHAKLRTERSQMNPELTFHERQYTASSRKSGSMSLYLSESGRRGRSISLGSDAEVSSPRQSLARREVNSIEGRTHRGRCANSYPNPGPSPYPKPFDPLISLEIENSIA